MNADDTAKPPANGSFLPPNPNATPASGTQPVRREGILPTSGAQPATGGQPANGQQPTHGQQPAARQQPPQAQQPASGSMPQRSAFRPTTGVAPSGAQPTTGQQAPAPTQQGAPSGPRAGASATPPSIAPTRSPERPQFAPTSGAPVAAPFATGVTAGAAASSPTVTAPSGAPASSETATTGGALSVTDRFKSLAGRATDTTKSQLEKSEKARNVEATTGPRKARVLVSRIDPWSSLKIGFLLSIAAGIMTVVAVHVLWNVLNSMGTFTMIQEWISRLFTEESELDFLQFVEYGKVMSATLLIAVVNVFLLTGLATIGALLYNMISRVVGGVYVTLTDD